MDNAWPDVTKEMKNSDPIHQSTKGVVWNRHIENYIYNFSDPITKNEDTSIPYLRNKEGSLLLDDELKPQLYMELLNREENRFTGAKMF